MRVILRIDESKMTRPMQVDAAIGQFTMTALLESFLGLIEPFVPHLPELNASCFFDDWKDSRKA